MLCWQGIVHCYCSVELVTIACGHWEQNRDHWLLMKMSIPLDAHCYHFIDSMVDWLVMHVSTFICLIFLFLSGVNQQQLEVT